jgi:hypothetical protein
VLLAGIAAKAEVVEHEVPLQAPFLLFAFHKDHKAFHKDHNSRTENSTWIQWTKCLAFGS